MTTKALPTVGIHAAGRLPQGACFGVLQVALCKMYPSKPETMCARARAATPACSREVSRIAPLYSLLRPAGGLRVYGCNSLIDPNRGGAVQLQSTPPWNALQGRHHNRAPLLPLRTPPPEAEAKRLLA